VEQQRQKLLTELAKAEAAREEAADALAEADGAHREAAQTLRAAQAAVADEREGRARAEARLQGPPHRPTQEGRNIRDTLGCAAEGCLALAEVADAAQLPGLEEADSQLTRFKADRERLGGVNLQADDDLVALSEQFEGMNKEKADVEAAIGKLRAGI